MKRRRIILLMLLGIVLTITATILVAYICQTGRFAAAVYRWTGSGKWLYSALYHGVQNGQTIEQVERLLGPGKEATDSKVYNVSKKFAASNPAGWPDGCEQSDKFLEFRLPSGGLWLQFRNGVLINFNPEDFQKYEEPVTMRAD